jgi:hypothetical protein
MQKILLLYTVPNPDSTGKLNLYKQFDAEEELHRFVAEKKELYHQGFVVETATRIVNSRQIIVSDEIK